MTKWNRVSFCMACFVGFPSEESFALSAITAKVIQGNSPRFISEIENHIESNKHFKYFGVVYNGNAYFNTVDLNNALGGNVASKTPASLKLSTVIKQPQSDEVMDLDGDGDIILSEDSANPLTLAWYYEDAKNNEVKLTPTQTSTAFSALLGSGIYPYIKISGPVTLNTRYGVPNFQSYPDNDIAISKTPYRNFNIAIGGEAIKYASPNMHFSDHDYSYRDKTIFDYTPATLNGFVAQNDYLRNFPSTGANNLYFYLVTDGIDNSLNTTNWTVRTSNIDDSSPSAITATVTKSTAPGITGFKAYNNKNMVLVTLKGPDSSAKTRTQTTPQIPTANLPVDIELAVTTKQKVKLSYKFRINKWFVNRGSIVAALREQREWCNNLGDYKLAEARDLSNARLLNLIESGRNTFNFYKRYVGEGFLSEWGPLTHYSGANFYNATYAWSNTVVPSNGDNFIYVNMNDGALHHILTHQNLLHYAICVTK
ncbi:MULTISPECIES: hypothetical protein [unclassified Gilliamella]|uniref:hypothetical protein n=1 Tax=unclassified Gilliamella TaxID=2685620 RepID=UPI001323C230|nr:MULTISPECIES: hypothetical protein [unclassified Gilliamella]MWN31303.1 hypothetical protein [Gilliamella sp. Pra-s60]MWP29089.1 hypothetical protein [Gilliamella sp. Pra-s54]